MGERVKGNKNCGIVKNTAKQRYKGVLRMDYKKAFYSKLEDCYLGVKIKDFHQGNIAKSGFSNLLKIKEQYFAHIKAYLDSQIKRELFSHDIYNKLFTFFDSYLNESGTPFLAILLLIKISMLKYIVIPKIRAYSTKHRISIM